MKQFRVILSLTLSHLVVVALGAGLAVALWFDPSSSSLWTPEEVATTFAIAGAAKKPDQALAALRERSDLPDRTRRILELYVNAKGSRGPGDAYAARAVELCQELGWPRCEARFIRSAAGEL